MYIEKTIRVFDKDLFDRGYILSYRRVYVRFQNGEPVVKRMTIANGIIEKYDERSVHLYGLGGKFINLSVNNLYDEKEPVEGEYFEIVAIRQNALSACDITHSIEVKK